MNKSKHTPGPWTAQITCTGSINLYGDNVWVGRIHHDHRKPGKRPIDGFPSNVERDANASLIIAAPELLAAIEKLLAVWVDGAPNGGLAIDAARSAIAKAKGEES